MDENLVAAASSAARPARPVVQADLTRGDCRCRRLQDLSSLIAYPDRCLPT